MVKDIHYFDFLDSLLKGDRPRSAAIVASLIDDGTDIKDIYTNLYQKALYRIGKMWEQNKLTIAGEHIATQIIESLLSQFLSPPETTTGKTAVISCIDKEFHHIGARMVANIFEANGWQTFFLGANTPTRELLSFIREKNPQVIGLSFNFYLNYLRLLEVLDSIKKEIPSAVIFVGGQGIANMKEKIAAEYTGIHHFESLNDVDEFLKKEYPLVSS